MAVNLRDVRNRQGVRGKDADSRFEFRNRTSRFGEIFIYGPIGEDIFGDGITAESFRREFRGLGSIDTLDLHIDSPGGSVSDARAIYTLLDQSRAKVNVKVDGFAASAASLIAMAGDTISIAEGGAFVIHEANGVFAGNKTDLKGVVDLLTRLDNVIAETYNARTGIATSQLKKWMNAETWFFGPEAVEKGFADTLMNNKTVTAFKYAEFFNRVPTRLTPRKEKLGRVLEAARGTLENVRSDTPTTRVQ